MLFLRHSVLLKTPINAADFRVGWLRPQMWHATC